MIFPQILAKRDYFLRLANAIANPSVCRLSDVYDVYVHLYSLLRGFNFSGIFLHHKNCNPATHPPKITKIVQGDHPLRDPEQISLTGVWLCDSSKVAKPPISSSHVWLSHLLMSFW